MTDGTILDGFLLGDIPGLSVDVPGDHILPQDARGGTDSLEQLSGALTNEQPITIRSLALTGGKTRTFLDDFYNRIHIFPAIVNVGAATGGSSSSTIIWNAYLTDSVLDDITVTNGDGVTLSGISPPKTYKPLEYTIITITVDPTGAPTINAHYIFNFDSLPDDVELSVIGRRATLWPFSPNWRDSVDVIFEFLTDLFTARSGREQRRALRRTPRRTIEFTNTLDAAQSRVYRRLMTTWQNKPWLLADPVRKVLCPDGAVSGSLTILVADLPAWVAVDQTMLFGESVMATVDSIDVDTKVLTLTAALADDVVEGATMRPVLAGRLTGQIQSRNPTSGSTEVSTSFTIDPGTEPVDEGSVGDTLDGREIFLPKQNWGESVGANFDWPIEQVDFNFGRVATYTPFAFGTMTRQATFVAQSPEEATYIQQFFCRQRGRRGEWLLPTWLNDLPPQVDLIEGTNTLRVAGVDTDLAYENDAIYQSVAVMLKNGDRIYRKVQSISTVDDEVGNDTILNCDDNWDDDVSVDDISMICWLPVVRFAVDQITIEWLTTDVAQTVLSAQTLEYLTAET